MMQIRFLQTSRDKFIQPETLNFLFFHPADMQIFLCLVRGVATDELLSLKFSSAEISMSFCDEQTIRGLCNQRGCQCFILLTCIGVTSHCLCCRMHVPTHLLKRYPTPHFNTWDSIHSVFLCSNGTELRMVPCHLDLPWTWRNG